MFVTHSMNYRVYCLSFECCDSKAQRFMNSRPSADQLCTVFWESTKVPKVGEKL